MKQKLCLNCRLYSLLYSFGAQAVPVPEFTYVSEENCDRCVGFNFLLFKYTFFFPRRMKLKYVKLKKYLEEVNERQKKALLRNQAFLNEFNEFEAQMKASSSELIEKMEVTF